MNIANIFGMYLGCMVEALFGPYSYKLYSVNREGGAYVDNLKTAERLYVNLENCKLLLTPLDKITEEDKREFDKEFNRGSKLFKIMGNSKEFVDGAWLIRLVTEEIKDDCYPDNEMMASTAEIFWLCKKGYDVGIVPDEYKEVK